MDSDFILSTKTTFPYVQFNTEAEADDYAEKCSAWLNLPASSLTTQWDQPVKIEGGKWVVALFPTDKASCFVEWDDAWKIESFSIEESKGVWHIVKSATIAVLKNLFSNL